MYDDLAIEFEVCVGITCVL